MLVKDKMTSELFVVSPDTLAPTALKLMKDGRFRRLPVVQDEKVVGIVTDRELRDAPSPDAVVAEVMHKHPVTIQEDDLIETAALVMRNNKVGALPVMRGKTLVGIITESDIFDTFIDMMGMRGPGRRLPLLLPDVAGSLATVTRIISGFGFPQKYACFPVASSIGATKARQAGAIPCSIGPEISELAPISFAPFSTRFTAFVKVSKE